MVQIQYKLSQFDQYETGTARAAGRPGGRARLELVWSTSEWPAPHVIRGDPGIAYLAVPNWSVVPVRMKSSCIFVIGGQASVPRNARTSAMKASKSRISAFNVAASGDGGSLPAGEGYR